MKNVEIEELKWGTCSNCLNAEDGVCGCCPDEVTGEIIGLTEISDTGTCENWKLKKEG